jgi:hypothetical protein
MMAASRSRKVAKYAGIRSRSEKIQAAGDSDRKRNLEHARRSVIAIRGKDATPLDGMRRSRRKMLSKLHAAWKCPEDRMSDPVRVFGGVDTSVEQATVSMGPKVHEIARFSMLPRQARRCTARGRAPGAPAAAGHRQAHDSYRYRSTAWPSASSVAILSASANVGWAWIV